MQTLQLRDAKTSLSAVVASAQRGQPTLITRHGQPSAMVVPVVDGQRLYPLDAPSLAAHLLAMPEPITAPRDRSPLRSVEL